MGQYILGRIVSTIPVLFGISIVVFMLLRIIPGDAIDVLVGPEAQLTPEARESLRRQLGLDLPIHVQYARWASGVLHGDMGLSLRTARPVTATIVRYWPRTMELAVLSLTLSVVLAVPLGVISAVQRNSLIDLLVRFLGILGLSLPSFWLATMVILITSNVFRWSPPLMLVGFSESPGGHFQQLFLPSITLGFVMMGVIMRMTRTMFLEVLAQDYIRVARAKGLRERSVLFSHALKNALIPIVTVVGMQMGYLLAGAVIVEQVFGLPGIGWLLLNAVYQRDYPLIQGTMLVLALTFLTVNLAVDVSYAYLDPRIRY